jgi:hypothetical protein
MAGKASDAPIPEKQIVNLPWWRYVEFLFDEVIQSIDIVYSNANLCEMTADARRCVLQVSQRMLAASPVGMFFYIGPGQQAQCTVDELKSEMRSNGFHRVAETPFAAWTTRPEAAAAVQALFAEGIPFFNPSGRPGLYPADLVMRIPRNEAPVDIPYARWSSGWEPSYRD